MGGLTAVIRKVGRNTFAPRKRTHTRQRMKGLTALLCGLLITARSETEAPRVALPAVAVELTVVHQEVTEFIGAVIRGDRSLRKIALVVTGDEVGDGLSSVIHTLKAEKVHASFVL